MKAESRYHAQVFHRRRQRCRRCGLGLLFLLLLPKSLGIARGGVSPSDPKAVNVFPLRPGESIEREIRPGDRHVYRIPVQAGALLDGDILPQGLGLSVSLYGSDGHLMLGLESPGANVSPGPLLVVTPAAGDLRLEVQSSARAAGHYRITLRPARRPTETDRQRAGAALYLSQGNSCRARNKDQEACPEYASALQSWRRGDQEPRGITLCRLAQNQDLLGASASAFDSFGAAREEFMAEGNAAGMAIATEGMARALYFLQKFEESKKWYGEALTLFRDTGNLMNQAEVLANLGLAYRRTDDLKEALPRYETALALFEDLGDVEQQATLLNNLGQLFLDMGRPHDAIAWFQQALRIKSDSPVVLDSQLLVLTGLGMAHYRLGNTHQALVYLRQARESPRTGKGPDYARVVSLKRLAHILLDAGRVDPRKLQWAYAAAEKARAIAHRIIRPGDEAYVTAMSGWALALQGRHEGALKVFAAAQKLFHDRQEKAAEAEVLVGIAYVERARGHLSQAQDAMESSLQLVESLRRATSSLEMRSSFWFQLRWRYEFYIDLLMELDRLNPGKGYDVRAFEVSESARARTVLDELVEAGAKVWASASPKLLEKDAALRREIEQIQWKRHQTIPQGTSPGTRSTTEALDQELALAIAHREVVAAELRGSSPGYDELLKARPRSLAQIQREVLDRDTILLSYWLGEKESILWRVDRRSLHTYRLPGRDQIQTLAIKLRDHFALGNITVGEGEAARTAARLGTYLLGPVADQLDATHLLILPDGALQYVPFAALGLPGGNVNAWPERPLIVDHDILRLPSASALSLLKRERAGRKPPPHTLAVLANPVFRRTDPRLQRLRPSGQPSSEALKLGQLPDLPFSEQEAKEILQLVPPGEEYPALGFDASLQTAKGPKLGQYGIVHFATHSLLDERPDLSGLVLSQFDAQGRPQDGFLRALDLYELNLPVELVVLSACQTNQGEDQAGEGIGRLTRGFLYAGARRVAVTLWSIRDRATADLMIRFYRGLLREGLSPAAALRQAQLSMRAEKRWRSPYYWAGFVLQGEW